MIEIDEDGLLEANVQELIVESKQRPEADIKRIKNGCIAQQNAFEEFGSHAGRRA